MSTSERHGAMSSRAPRPPREGGDVRHGVTAGREVLEVSVVADDDDGVARGVGDGREGFEKALGALHFAPGEEGVLRVAGFVREKELEEREVHLARAREHAARGLGHGARGHGDSHAADDLVGEVEERSAAFDEVIDGVQAPSPSDRRARARAAVHGLRAVFAGLGALVRKRIEVRAGAASHARAHEDRALVDDLAHPRVRKREQVLADRLRDVEAREDGPRARGALRQPWHAERGVERAQVPSLGGSVAAAREGAEDRARAAVVEGVVGAGRSEADAVNEDEEGVRRGRGQCQVRPPSEEK